MIDEHPFIVANALQSSANRYLLGFRVKLARREARKRGNGKERERERMIVVGLFDRHLRLDLMPRKQ